MVNLHHVTGVSISYRFKSAIYNKQETVIKIIAKKVDNLTGRHPYNDGLLAAVSHSHTAVLRRTRLLI